MCVPLRLLVYFFLASADPYVMFQQHVKTMGKSTNMALSSSPRMYSILVTLSKEVHIPDELCSEYSATSKPLSDGFSTPSVLIRWVWKHEYYHLEP